MTLFLLSHKRINKRVIANSIQSLRKNGAEPFKFAEMYGIVLPIVSATAVELRITSMQKNPELYICRLLMVSPQKCRKYSDLVFDKS